MTNKILIIMPNWLGDFIMALPFVKEIIALHQGAFIDLLVIKRCAHIPLDLKINAQFSFDNNFQSKKKSAFTLRKRHYQKIYILPMSFSSALMAYIIGAKERIGYTSELRAGLLTNRLRLKNPRQQHLSKEYLGLLHSKNAINLDGCIDRSALKKKVQSLMADFSIPEKYCIIAPSARYGPSKIWPFERYAQIIKKLEEQGIATVLIGTNDELTEQLTKQINQTKAINLIGKTDLNAVFALLLQSCFLICNDSGVMHVGAALQIKQIAIFGSTSPRWTAPLNSNAVILYQQQDCAPCFQKTCRFKHYDCLTAITITMVWQAVLAFLKEDHGKSI